MFYDNVCAYIWLNFCAFGEKSKREGIGIIGAKVRINNNNNKQSIKICLAISQNPPGPVFMDAFTMQPK